MSDHAELFYRNQLAAANQQIDKLTAKNARLKSMMRGVDKRNRSLEKQTDKAHNAAIYADVDVVHLREENERLREALGEAVGHMDRHFMKSKIKDKVAAWRELASGKAGV